MSKEMVISANPHETRVAVLEDGQLCEIYVEREKEFALVGSIYKGRVTRVLPGMQSSFVDIGLDGDAFLYVSDVLEDLEEYDQIVTTVEDKVQKMEDQGGQIFPTAINGSAPVEPAEVVAAESAPPPAEESASLSSLPGEQISEHRVAESTPSDSSRRSFDPRARGMRQRGGRGRGRRFGRDLPPSKYASHHSREPQGGYSSAAAGEEYVPTLLPGESIAKLKVSSPPGKPAAEPAAEASAVPAGETAAYAGAQEDVRPLHEIQEPQPQPESNLDFGEHSSASLEVLPGESLPRTLHPESGAFELHGEPEAVKREEESEALDEAAHTEAGEIRAHAADSNEPSESFELTPAETNALVEAFSETAEEEELETHENELENAAETQLEELHQEALAAEESITELSEPREDAPSADEPETSEEAGAPSESDLPRDSQPWSARVRSDFRARMQHPARRHERGRGRRGERDRRHRQPRGRVQSRRPHLISEMLKPGQEIVVQIAKEPLGKKGARITSHIALPGRYLVYMPTLDHTGVSRKIASAEERARLRHLVNEAKGEAGGGFIVRTAAAQANPEDIRADVQYLTHTWSEIKARAEQRKAPALLHRDLNLVERILRDHLNSDFTAIWVDNEEEYTKVVEFVSRFQPSMAGRVKLYTKSAPVFEEFGIQQEVDKSLRPKVWLKSGGYIVINHTEALVAIDVNTGKYVGKGSTRLEDTIVRTNLEAVKEIVRQIRLRDLGGIIVIDFIDMEERRNREKVMAALDEALRTDRAPSKVLRFNEFGLVAITRKRTKQALERTLCQPCPYCTGSGMVKSIPTLCYEIQAEARKMAPEVDSASLTLRVHPEIAKALKTRESLLLEELERWTKKSIIIQADPTLHWEQYDIY